MSVIINDEIIEKIKDYGDIVDLISEYVDLKKSGSSYMGLCPFHNEKTPSFSVSPEKQFFKCFGCGEGGDIIEFFMKKENVDFIEAVKLLADRYNIELEAREIDPRKVKKKDRFLKMNRDAARFFYRNLQSSTKVLIYLQNRNIKKNMIKRFGLGFALDSWDSLYKYLIEKGYKEKEIEENGLIVLRKDKSGYYDRFRNRIIFPIIDNKGKVIGFGGRVLDDSMPKYLNSKDSLVFDKSSNLYGINLVHKFSKREKILLVEGYMDVIALNQAGINYAVASLGTSLTERQAKLLKRYGRDVYIAFDSDKAGIKASLRAIDILLGEGIKPKLVRLPEGKDPDDFISDNGFLEFEKKIVNSDNYIDFQIDILKENYNLDNLEEIISFTREVAKIISAIDSPVGRDVYINKISEETKVSKKAIEDEILNLINVKKFSSISKSNKINKDKKKLEKNLNENINYEGITYKGYFKAQENLLCLILKNKDYYLLTSNQLEYIDFSDAYRDIFKIISDIYYENDEVSRKLLSEYSNNSKSLEKLENLFDREVDYDETKIEVILEDLIKTIMFYNLNRERDKIVKLINKLEKNNDINDDNSQRFSNLCILLTDLNNQINLLKD